MINNVPNINTRQDFFTNPEIQKRLNLIMGLNNTKEKKRDLTPEQKKAVVKNYVTMYYGLVSAIWANGAKLGVAWQSALDKMEEFVKSKTKVLGHPMNPYLTAIHAKYRRVMSETILTNPYVNMDFGLEGEVKKKWLKFANEDMQKGLGFFNNLHKAYMPKQNIQQLNKNADEPFMQAQIKAQEMMKKKLIFLSSVQNIRDAA